MMKNKKIFLKYWSMNSFMYFLNKIITDYENYLKILLM